MILTKQEIAEKAVEIVEEKCEGKVFPEDNWVDGYKEGWNECTEHYLQQIQKAEKWNELVNFCNEVTIQFVGGKRTEETAIEVGTQILNKVTELLERKTN